MDKTSPLGTGPRPLRVRGVGRVADEPRAILVMLSDIPTDDEMREFHDFVRPLEELVVDDCAATKRIARRRDPEGDRFALRREDEKRKPNTSDGLSGDRRHG